MSSLAAPALIIPKFVVAQANAIDGNEDIKRLRSALAMNSAGSQGSTLVSGGTSQSPAGVMRQVNARMAEDNFGTGASRSRSDRAPIIQDASAAAYVRFRDDGNYCGPLIYRREAKTLLEGPNLTVFSQLSVHLRSNNGLGVNECKNLIWPTGKSILQLEEKQLVDPVLRARANITKTFVKNVRGYWQDRDVLYAHRALTLITYEHNNGNPTGVSKVEIILHGDSYPTFEANFQFYWS